MALSGGLDEAAGKAFAAVSGKYGEAVEIYLARVGLGLEGVVEMKAEHPGGDLKE